MIEIGTEDLHWLAGLMEGEGSFMRGVPSAPNTPKMVVNMTDEDVIVRIAKMWKSGVWKLKRRTPRHKQAYSTMATGSRAVAWMRLLRPLMGIRRRSQIDSVFSSYEPRKFKIPRSMDDKIISMVDGGMTRTAVAKKFGTSVDYICRIYRGRKRSPRVVRAAEVAVS